MKQVISFIACLTVTFGAFAQTNEIVEYLNKVNEAKANIDPTVLLRKQKAAEVKGVDDVTLWYHENKSSLGEYQAQAMAIIELGKRGDLDGALALAGPDKGMQSRAYQAVGQHEDALDCCTNPTQRLTVWLAYLSNNPEDIGIKLDKVLTMLEAEPLQINSQAYCQLVCRFVRYLDKLGYPIYTDRWRVRAQALMAETPHPELIHQLSIALWGYAFVRYHEGDYLIDTVPALQLRRFHYARKVGYLYRFIDQNNLNVKHSELSQFARNAAKSINQMQFEQARAYMDYAAMKLRRNNVYMEKMQELEEQ